VIEAAARFPRADFVLVGDGMLRERLQREVDSRGLKNVEFTGAIGQDAVRAQYRRSDIFFFPSQWEGSPKVILEAAACGLPVIARNNYRPETVISEATGFLANSDAELYAALQQLIADPQRRRTMGMAGRRHIAQFDWSPITRRWEEIFLSLAS
jgi:glycosyltransferase involved in cell wall biosynthesis